MASRTPPTLHSIHPQAVLPHGEIEVSGTGLHAPLAAEIEGVPAHIALARPTRAILQIAEGTLPGDLIIAGSNALHVEVAIPMAENLHPVTNPATDDAGNIYTTLSGSRGQQTPVSIFRIAPAPAGVTHELRPYAREILNPSGLAFGPDGLLYVSSRAEGTIYRVGSAGVAQAFAEGLGIATGIAFDAAGDLYVGDRSGTIFKIHSQRDPQGEESNTTFVFATLEPSIAFYHLAFSPTGTLYVTGPTTSSSQSIYAIAPDGTISIFYSGLGRAQGLAVDAAGDVYAVASLHGDRGIVRITPAAEHAKPHATLVLSGSNLVGLCLLPNGRAALATRDAVYEVTLGHTFQPLTSASAEA